MARNDPDFEVESTVDLDNIDTAAAEKLLARAGGDDDIDIETIADPRISPEDARAKPLPADSNADPTEEELQAYSEQVQKRIKTLSHARHDERREKEAAQRERDDAVAYARQMHARATALESQSENLTNNALSGAIEKISGQLEAARKEYVAAADAYDTEAMSVAQLNVADLVSQKRQAEMFQAQKTFAQQNRPVVQQEPTARAAPDVRAQDWAARNDAWFQKDKAMTAFAFGVHDDLVSKGVDPRTDPESYYKHLDGEVQARFPERFASQQDTRRQTSPVASASRSVAGRRKVTLTQTELALAKRLNVTPEDFAREKIKLERTNG